MSDLLRNQSTNSGKQIEAFYISPFIFYLDMNNIVEKSELAHEYHEERELNEASTHNPKWTSKSIKFERRKYEFKRRDMQWLVNLKWL